MIGNIILIVFIGFFLFGAGIIIGEEVFDSSIAGCILGIILVIALIVGDIIYINNTESGKRIKKDFSSDWNGGIERTITVYDINGNVIESYEGKFDIEYSDGHIKFEDEKDNRHIIYYTTGTIIINEKDEEKQDNNEE